MRSVGTLVILLILLALVGPWFAPHDPTQINIPNRLSPPGAEWLLGTDALGRDILSRLLHGARWSLGLAFVISVIGLCIGTLMGLLAAQGGKLADWVVMRTTDTFLAFPDLVAAVVIAGVLGAGTGSLIFALTVTGWMRYARVARGIGLSLQTRGYVVQARLAGTVTLRHRPLALSAIAFALAHRCLDGHVRPRHPRDLCPRLSRVRRATTHA